MKQIIHDEDEYNNDRTEERKKKMCATNEGDE